MRRPLAFCSSPLLLSLLLFSACSLQHTPEPELSIVDAQVKDVNLLETGMEFSIKVTNHSAEPLFIDGSVYRIFINDVDIGTGSSGDVLEVPRFSSATQKVRIGLSNLSMFQNIRALVESKKFDYRVEGEFYLKGGTFRRKAFAEDSAHFDFANFDIDTPN